MSRERSPHEDRRDKPARGIRAGKSARRKREAFRRYESDRLGIPVEDVAVIHFGGQARPLGTSPFWQPEKSDPSGDEAAVDIPLELLMK